jgi:hypothetical protein
MRILCPHFVLRLLQGLRFACPFPQMGVKAFHEKCGGLIIDFP